MSTPIYSSKSPRHLHQLVKAADEHEHLGARGLDTNELRHGPAIAAHEEAPHLLQLIA